MTTNQARIHSPPGSAAATPPPRPAPPALSPPWPLQSCFTSTPASPRGTSCSSPRVLFVPATQAATITAEVKKLKDPQIVVVDEVLGQWIALAGARTLNWKSYLAAFALFRLFDIWKPPPVRQLESLPGGLGINLDDVMAGVYGALVLFLAGCFNLY